MNANTNNSTLGRHLTEAEITRLQKQGCTASDWSLVTVHPDIDLQYIYHVDFFGSNRLGRFRKTHKLAGGIRKHSGIHHAALRNTTIGDDCLIENVTSLSHYNIEYDCLILNTDTLITEGESTFGQGTAIAVLNETGGREIIMHSQLSAQEAYLQAMYRHDAALTGALHALAQREAEKCRRRMGTVGKGSRIVRCGYLRNIRFGQACTVEGAARLENGTICSTAEAPAYIGERVIAKDFIIQAGAKVTDGAMLTRCHVGAASVIGHGFSATDVYFASNCQAENGEACAVFAGPYTVSHHKSTLLIGGMFSFMNAGSGTNQSNHMYKLGPSHQGILERGCKTASGSHILWPARCGAFSMVMGHYKSHADTTLFPFSYLVEQLGGNCLIPGIALRNVGTFRDIQKWPQRDHRPASIPPADQITFDAYSPYTAGKMLKALPLLQTWEQQTAEEQDTVVWQGLTVKKKNITLGREFYQSALERFFGDQLLQQFQQHRDAAPETLYSLLRPTAGYCDIWCDLGGLLAPQSETERLVKDIKSGNIASADDFLARTLYIYKHYEAWTWAWTWHQIMLEHPNANAGNFTVEVCLPVLRKWANSSCRLNGLIIADAEKEFAPGARIGFGVDGNAATAEADFRAVKGCPETNSVINELRCQQDDIMETLSYWEHRLA